MSVITANDTDILNVVGDRLRVIAEGSATGGAFEVFDVEGDEGSRPLPHAHPWTESFYVLEGSLMVTVGDEQTLARPAPASWCRTVHTFQVAASRARFLTTTSGDKASACFRDLASRAPGVPSGETLPLVIAVAERHGLTWPLFD